MNLDNVTESPGVYLWKDKFNNVIYVGKSKSLKKRMTQYFNGSINSFKTIKMVEKIKDYEIIICNNENEALILENETREANESIRAGVKGKSGRNFISIKLNTLTINSGKTIFGFLTL